MGRAVLRMRWRGFEAEGSGEKFGLLFFDDGDQGLEMMEPTT